MLGEIYETQVLGVSDFFLWVLVKEKKWKSGMAHIDTGIAISLRPSEDSILDQRKYLGG